VLSVDVRHGSDDVRRAACAALEAGAREIAGARAVELSWETLQDTAAVACSPALTEPLAEAVADAGHRVVRLLSGAGHDAVTMAALGPIAMLFVRCAGGVSHNPAESVELADVAAAIDVMSRFLERVPCTT
jgi:acetylornithine deacetylase/succinyl-diaminopimelate desuccinylase-like protein